MSHARMKGNKGADGERLPALPFVFREGNRLDPLTTLMPDMLPKVSQKGRRSPARAVLLPLVAVIAVAVVIVMVAAQFLGGEEATGGDVPSSGGGVTSSISPGGDGAAAVIDATATVTATEQATQQPSATATAPPATNTIAATATSVAPTATATPSGLVRVRYVVGNGESCHSIRAKFGFDFEDAEDFFTALGRLTGKSAATQCSFFPGDVVCVPAKADLLQLGVLARDVACITGQ